MLNRLRALMCAVSLLALAAGPAAAQKDVITFGSTNSASSNYALAVGMTAYVSLP